MQTAEIYWTHKTRIGTVAIVARGRGWTILLGDQNLGSGYPSAISALDDLVGGHTFSPSCGTDTSILGIPDDLSDWSAHRR